MNFNQDTIHVCVCVYASKYIRSTLFTQIVCEVCNDIYGPMYVNHADGSRSIESPFQLTEETWRKCCKLSRFNTVSPPKLCSSHCRQTVKHNLNVILPAPQTISADRHAEQWSVLKLKPGKNNKTCGQLRGPPQQQPRSPFGTLAQSHSGAYFVG